MSNTQKSAFWLYIYQKYKKREISFKKANVSL